ncbi:MAG: hypothetical protein HW415_1632 [Deltaproteobacteria bacterium]|nr:hypothetical protein [Deltaproteobacteria bacterium]
MFLKGSGTGFEEMLLKYVYKDPKPLTGTELKALASNVGRLSSLLTRERETLPVAYLKNEALRRAYLLYFLPSNLDKIHIPLHELSLHPSKALSKQSLRILDIGSGPGTAILGIMGFFSAKEKRPVLEFTAIDQVKENLRDSEALFGLFRERVSIAATLKTIKSSMEMASSFPKGPYDIIVLSNILNEVAHPDEDRTSKRVAILKTVLSDLLAPDGSCIIIEPALRQTSRDMLEVRDGLLDEGFCIYSPCLMGEKCPALQNPKDWCHEDIAWEFPEIVREVDSLTGLRKDSLKFSYLVLRKDGLSIKDIYGDSSFRVVSESLVSKGKIEFYVCGKEGRRMVTRLDKDKTIKNKAFEDLMRGDIVGFEGVIDEGKRLRVGKETNVVSLDERICCQRR